MTAGETASAIATAKYTGYLGAFGIFEYLAIPEMQLNLLGVLLVFDFITGIGKHLRSDRKQITSVGAWVGAMKKVATFIAVMTIAIVFKALEMDPGAYIKAVIAIFIMVEAYSIMQNVYAIRTGIILPEYDVISLLIKAFMESLKKKIEKMIKIATAEDVAVENAIIVTVEKKVSP